MIGMDFVSFLILLATSLVVSGILHYGCEYYVTSGNWSFAAKVVVGWIGAWLGSPVLGHWWPGCQYGEIYYVPAILGAAAAVILAVDLAKMAQPRTARAAAAVATAFVVWRPATWAAGAIPRLSRFRA